MTATTPSARRWLIASAACVALTAAAALAASAGISVGEAVRPAESASPVGRIVSVGPARVVIPADWRSVPRIAGLEDERVTLFQPASRPWTRVVAAFDPTVTPSLVPQALRLAGLRAEQTPTASRLGGWPAWTYDADLAAVGMRGGSVTVLATTAGVLAVACTSVAGRRADADCAADVGSIAVPGASTLVPSRSLALEIHLPQLLDRLNRRRSRYRGKLSGARTNRSQALAARRLDADHRSAANELRRLDAPVTAPLIRELTTVADAYRALAGAADDASTGGFASAATGVRRAEAALSGALATVSRPRTAAVPADTAMPRQERAGSAPAGVPTLLFAFLTSLSLTAGAFTGNRRAAGLWRGRPARQGGADSDPDVQAAPELPLVMVGNGARTHAWRGDHPACRRSGYSSLSEPRTASKVTHVGTGDPTCPLCRAAVSGSPSSVRSRP